jgi:peptidoglycan/xylan/chitin deacetylase (PgdA/CDA1 family)
VRSLFLVVLAACSGMPQPAGLDGSVGADAPELDAALPDAPIDAPVDAPPDAAPDAPPDAPADPPTLTAITPTTGSVAGGTFVMLEGSGFTSGTTVAIGGVSCAPVVVMSATLLACTTGDSHFVEGAKDVVVTNPDTMSATLPAAFTYECPWTTSLGRRSCGAVPPHAPFPAQVVASWITQLQAGHGFVAGGPASAGDNLDDTSDAVLGTQSAVIETDGAGTLRTLTRTGLSPIDFTGYMPKLWVKIDHVTSAASLQLVLGDSNLANQFRFSFHSTQGQRWTTDGDWVALTMSWAPENVTVVGTPDRAAITDVQLRVIDNATGTPVRLHVNGIALVAEPVATYPDGVLTFTFDDNYATMVSAGLPPLTAHGFPATAYVITDMVGESQRATLADLHVLQDDHGWEIAAHAGTDLHHFARYPNLSAQVLEDDMVDARAWLIANGFAGYDHCSYPGGDFTGGIGTDVLALSRRYFATCRTIYQGERETYPPADSAKLRVFYVTNAVTLASAMTAVDHAKANREWIILVFHSLVAAPASSTEWSATDFTMLVEHIASTGIPVKTIGQVLTD